MKGISISIFVKKCIVKENQRKFSSIRILNMGKNKFL